jgi:hypothetical protein
MRRLALFGFALGSASAVALASRPAEACGGTFCDTQPTSMPVDQTGETILFVLDQGFVEAHIQIQYESEDASKFAWVLPLPEVPEIEVGSWRLVDAVLDATVPVHGMPTTSTCNDGSPLDEGGIGFIDSPDGGSGGAPTIVAHDTVGAFEYVVLSGGTVEGVVQWLDDNGYAQDPEASPILEEYLDEGMVFVAFKLLNGAEVEDIHPIVVRYPGDEACIPLRLTRIAAADDMSVRAVFLGDARVHPLGYLHVKLNRTRLDWPSFGANYDELVSMAIDEAGGRAFVTEYAGSSDIVSTETLDTRLLDASVFVDLPIPQIVAQLEAMEMMDCGDGECTFAHELLGGLLRQYLPTPAGLTEGAFYSCLPCWAELVDESAWDGAAFAAAFSERIVAPMDHAREILQTWPYLTRMYTRISPNEMIADPFFIEIPELETVANLHGAQREDDCCGSIVRLPGGRVVGLYGDGWPSFAGEMPWAERVEEATDQGLVTTLKNDSALIDELVAAHNEGHACFVEGGTTGGADGTGGGPPGEGDDDDPGTSAQAESGTSGSTSGTELDGTAGGCGCRARGHELPVSMVAMVGLLGLRRRSR